MWFELPGNKYEKESWKSHPGFARGVRTGGEGWRSPLFERRLQRASGPRRTHRTARGEEPGGLVGGLCAGGAPGKGRWENQELLGSGDWESFSEGGGLQRPELPRGIPKALYSGFHHAEVAVGQQESRFGEGGGQET